MRQSIRRHATLTALALCMGSSATVQAQVTGEPDHPLTLEGDFDYEAGTGGFEGVTETLHWLAVGNPDGSALSHFQGTINTVGSK